MWDNEYYVAIAVSVVWHQSNAWPMHWCITLLRESQFTDLIAYCIFVCISSIYLFWREAFVNKIENWSIWLHLAHIQTEQHLQRLVYFDTDVIWSFVTLHNASTIFIINLGHRFHISRIESEDTIWLSNFQRNHRKNSKKSKFILIINSFID